MNLQLKKIRPDLQFGEYFNVEHDMDTSASNTTPDTPQRVTPVEVFHYQENFCLARYKPSTISNSINNPTYMLYFRNWLIMCTRSMEMKGVSEVVSVLDTSLWP